jgi:hypothetical protein
MLRIGTVHILVCYRYVFWGGACSFSISSSSIRSLYNINIFYIFYLKEREGRGSKCKSHFPALPAWLLKSRIILMQFRLLNVEMAWLRLEPYPVTYCIYKSQNLVNFDAAPAPAWKIKRLLAASASQLCLPDFPMKA